MERTIKKQINLNTVKNKEMEEFTKEELRWIIKQAKQKQKTAVGLPLLTKVFEIERKAVKKLTIPVVTVSF